MVGPDLLASIRYQLLHLNLQLFSSTFPIVNTIVDIPGMTDQVDGSGVICCEQTWGSAKLEISLNNASISVHTSIIRNEYFPFCPTDERLPPVCAK